MWIYNAVSGVWHCIRAGTMTECGNFGLSVTATSEAKPEPVRPARTCYGCARAYDLQEKLAKTDPVFAARLARLKKKAAETFSASE